MAGTCNFIGGDGALDDVIAGTRAGDNCPGYTRRERLRIDAIIDLMLF